MIECSAHHHLASPCLSVVMPCYNELGTVEVAIKRVLDLPYVAELIVVDDGSTDGTREVLERLSEPRLRIMLQDRNRGKGSALRTGFATATGTFIAVQDADLEYNPADLAKLLQPLLEGQADVVYGSRFLTSDAHRVLYFWHSLGNKALTTLSNMMTNLNLTDMETCYKVFRREILEQITIEEDRFGVEPELTAKVAALNCRIFEVGISYDGRSYAEGKKIGWRDGVRAVFSIGKYTTLAKAERRRATRRPVAFHEADAHLADTLDSLDDAENYAAWLASLIEPHLHGHILEVGSGHGTFSEKLSEFGRVTASEPSERAIERLRARLEHLPDIDVVHGDLASVTREQEYDGIVMLNVLEHIEDDAEALFHVHQGLRPGGRVAILVPAFELLYSPYDAAIGHHRRYRLPDLVRKVEEAGLEVEVARYVNSVGFLAWLVTARMLKAAPTQRALAAPYDRMVVPLLRRAEAQISPPFGQSALVIAQR